MSTKRKHEEVTQHKEEQPEEEEAPAEEEEDGDDGEEEEDTSQDSLKNIMLYIDPATKALLGTPADDLQMLLGSRGGTIVGDITTATHILSKAETDSDEYKVLSATGKPVLTEEAVMTLIRGDPEESKEGREANITNFFAAHGAGLDDDDEQDDADVQPEESHGDDKDDDAGDDDEQEE